MSFHCFAFLADDLIFVEYILNLYAFILIFNFIKNLFILEGFGCLFFWLVGWLVCPFVGCWLLVAWLLGCWRRQPRLAPDIGLMCAWVSGW